MQVFIGLLVFVIVLWVIIHLLGKSRPQPSIPGTQRVEEETGNRVFFTQVHGIYHKNDDGSSRQAIIKHCREGEELVLVLEPTNRYDPDAVKICRKNGEQLGYWKADGRLAHDIVNGWTYRVTVDEIYSFEDNPKKHGVRLRVEVLTMSRRTEERKNRTAGKTLAVGAVAGPEKPEEPGSQVRKPTAERVSAIQAEAAKTKTKEGWQSILLYFETANKKVYRIVKAETEDIDQALQDGMLQVGFVGLQDAPGGIKFAFSLNDGLPTNGSLAERFMANATEWVTKESRRQCAEKGLPAPVVHDFQPKR